MIAATRQRQARRNLRELKTERKTRCMWAAAKHGPVVRLFKKDGEDKAFGVCSQCEPVALRFRGYRPVDGPEAA